MRRKLLESSDNVEKPVGMMAQWWYMVSSHYLTFLVVNITFVLCCLPAYISFFLFVKLRIIFFMMLSALLAGIIGPAIISVTRVLLDILWGCHWGTMNNLAKEYLRNIKQGFILGWLLAFLMNIMLTPLLVMGIENVPLSVWLCVWLGVAVLLLFVSYCSIQAAAFSLSISQLSKNSVYLILGAGSENVIPFLLWLGTALVITFKSGLVVQLLLPSGVFLMLYAGVIVKLWPYIENKVHREE